MDTPKIIEIYDFVSTDTCKSISDSCEAKGQPEVTTVTHIDNKAEIKLQNQHRIRFVDPNIQAQIQNAIDEHNQISATVHDSFSYVRYENNGYVPLHIDAYTDISVTHSIIIYLNDDYEEGQTYIRHNGNTERIRPKTGKLLVFRGGELLHGSDRVKGVKRVLLGKLTVT